LPNKLNTRLNSPKSLESTLIGAPKATLIVLFIQEGKSSDPICPRTNFPNKCKKNSTPEVGLQGFLGLIVFFGFLDNKDGNTWFDECFELL
jgi:hypothetical protein